MKHFTSRTAGVVLAAALGLGCGTGGSEDIFGQGTAATTGSAGAQGGASSQASTSASTGGPASSGSGPGTGGAGGAASASASSGAGGLPLENTGCSDGTREGYIDLMAETKIAACAGGFSVPGVTTPESMQPQCGRVSGDDSANPTGDGCSVEDLCAEGWHVCHGAEDVAQHAANGACEPTSAITPVFWLTRQVQDGAGECAQPPNTNNVTGCGSLGAPPPPSCAPLARRMRYIECLPTNAWYCGQDINDGQIEAQIVLKVSSEEGGVLCCTN